MGVCEEDEPGERGRGPEAMPAEYEGSAAGESHGKNKEACDGEAKPDALEAVGARGVVREVVWGRGVSGDLGEENTGRGRTRRSSDNDAA